MSLTLNGFTLVRNSRTSGSSYTDSLTVAGNFLVIAVAGASGTAPTNITATYGGEAMVQRAIRLQGGSLGAVAIFTLEAPPTGTNNLVISIATGSLTSIAVGAWDFSGTAVVVGGAVTANGDNPATITRTVAAANTVLIAAGSYRSGAAASLTLTPAGWTQRHYANTQGGNSQDSSNLFADALVDAGSRSITTNYQFVGQIVATGLIEIAPVIPAAEAEAAGVLPLAGSGTASPIGTAAASGAFALAGSASALAIAAVTGTGVLPLGGSGALQGVALAAAAGVLPLTGSASALVVMPSAPRFRFTVQAIRRRFFVDAPQN